MHRTGDLVQQRVANSSFSVTSFAELGELAPLEFLGFEKLAESMTSLTLSQLSMNERIERVLSAAYSAVKEPE